MLAVCLDPPQQVRPTKGEAPSPGLSDGAEVFNVESSRLSCSLSVSRRSCWLTALCRAGAGALASLKVYELQDLDPCSLRWTLVEVDCGITCSILGHCCIRFRSQCCFVELFPPPLFHLPTVLLLLSSLQRCA